MQTKRRSEKSKEYNCPNNNSTSVTITQLLSNALSVFMEKNKDNPNLELYDCKLLVIDDFQDCNGKEATQGIIIDILQYRINKGLFTHLLSDYDYSDLKYISQKLNDLIIENFIVLWGCRKTKSLATAPSFFHLYRAVEIRGIEGERVMRKA